LAQQYVGFGQQEAVFVFVLCVHLFINGSQQAHLVDVLQGKFARIDGVYGLRTFIFSFDEQGLHVGKELVGKRRVRLCLGPPFVDVEQAFLYSCVAYVLLIVLLVTQFVEVAAYTILSTFEHCVVKSAHFQLMEECIDHLLQRLFRLFLHGIEQFLVNGDEVLVLEFGVQGIALFHELFTENVASEFLDGGYHFPRLVFGNEFFDVV